MSFKMRCPKCSSMSYTIERDTRTYTGAKSGEMVFSCRCGKQLFGEALDLEHQRQKALWEADPERQREERERDERRREIEQREDQLKKAFEYRKAWVAQKRAEQEAARQGQVWTPAPPKPAPAAPAPRAAEAARAAPAPTVARSARQEPAAPPARPERPRVQPEPAAPVEPRAVAQRTPDSDAPRESEPAARPEPARKAERAQPAEQNGEEFVENDAPNDEESSGEEGTSEMCLWEGCENRAAPNSKYCSRACSNKNARHRHAQRKKGDQAA